MKALANWFYKKTHHDELCAVAKFIKTKVEQPYPAPRESLGALEALTTLRLLVK